jgi:hypothetical protein
MFSLIARNRSCLAINDGVGEYVGDKILKVMFVMKLGY